MKEIDTKQFTRANVHCHIKPNDALKIVRELQGLSQEKLKEL